METTWNKTWTLTFAIGTQQYMEQISQLEFTQSFITWMFISSHNFCDRRDDVTIMSSQVHNCNNDISDLVEVHIILFLFTVSEKFPEGIICKTEVQNDLSSSSVFWSSVLYLLFRSLQVIIFYIDSPNSIIKTTDWLEVWR